MKVWIVSFAESDYDPRTTLCGFSTEDKAVAFLGADPAATHCIDDVEIDPDLKPLEWQTKYTAIVTPGKTDQYITREPKSSEREDWSQAYPGTHAAATSYASAERALELARQAYLEAMK